MGVTIESIVQAQSTLSNNGVGNVFYPSILLDMLQGRPSYLTNIHHSSLSRER
jgi:hypothetical protein